MLILGGAGAGEATIAAQISGALWMMAESAQSSANAQSASDLELFEQYLNQDMDLDMPGRGDLREGVIVEIRSSELLVNVGSKRDGVVPQSDPA